MTNLIKKYVYNVTKKLPEKVRKEVSFEIEANIYEMLGDDESYEHTIKVLNELGDPKKLSAQYKDETKTVVPSRYYDDYLMALRMTLIVGSILAFFFSTIYMLQKEKFKSVISHINLIIIVGIISVVFAIVFSYAIVTFIYHMKGLRKERIDDKWDISKLEELPKEGAYDISRRRVLAELGVSSIFGFLGLYILIFYPTIKLFKLTFEFNQVISTVFIPLFAICIILMIVKSAIKLKTTKINLKTVILDTVYYAYTAVVLIVFLLQPDLFTNISFESISQTTYNIIMISISGVIGLAVVVKTVILWIRYLYKY